MSTIFQMLNYRFHLLDRNKIVIRGFFEEDTKDAALALEIKLDKQMLDPKLEVFSVVAEGHVRELRAIVDLPEGWESASRMTLIPLQDSVKGSQIHIAVSELKKKRNEVDCHVDSSSVENKRLQAVGWAFANEDVQIKLCDHNGQETEAKILRTNRKDMLDEFPEVTDERKAGFVIEASLLQNQDQYLEFTADGRKTVVSIYHNFFGTSTGGFQSSSPLYMIKKVWGFYRKFGFKETARKTKRKLMKNRNIGYMQWIKTHEPSKKDLRQQAKEHLDGPKFSIVIPLYKTDPTYLKEMIASVINQTYTNWQLCLADGSITGEETSSPLTEVLTKYAAEDKRIVFTTLEQNAGISGNTNAAIELADGDYVIFADHDDVMAPHALYECAKVLMESPQTDIIYTDEDKLSMDSKTRFEPNFKPDFSPDFLCSVNYICHLFVVRKSLLDEAGYLDPAYDGAQDYDLILRCTEKTKEIKHIPMALYHWRSHLESTAFDPESKKYAFDAGRRAVQAHYDRLHLPAEVVDGPFYGLYRTNWKWEEKPLVSILIPNKDHIDDLEKCITSIEEKSTYRNLEIIIIENNSDQEETFAYYKTLEASYENVKVVYYDGDFNYSRINNFGETYASGDYLLLLNNDTELIAEDAIERMVGYCMREDVGIVGAKLLYPDDTIQHAGVIVGYGGVAGHTFIGKQAKEPGYQSRIVAAQNYSAVTAACLMTKRSVFREVGGLSEELRVAFNDIDYCMKVRSQGYLVVFDPDTLLYHYESKSRGLEDTKEKLDRFYGEMALFREKWASFLLAGDPYYNQNLTLVKSDFSLRDE